MDFQGWMNIALMTMIVFLSIALMKVTDRVVRLESQMWHEGPVPASFSGR